MRHLIWVEGRKGRHRCQKGTAVEFRMNFLRALRVQISEAIVAEDDEEGRLDRQIGEIDEQM